MAFRIEERRAVDTPPEEREKIYEAAWERGGLQFRAAFQDMMIDKSGERHGGRLRQAQDPLDRKGPEDRGDPVGHRSSLRRKAPADRHQLFRDLQPPQRHAGGSAQGADRSDQPRGDLHHRGRVPGRHHRLRHWIRRDDRPDVAHGHSRARRDCLEGRVGGGTAQLPRLAGRRLPEPVHDYRPGQPVGALQHAGGDRAARGLDHRLHQAHATTAASNVSRRGPTRWTNGSRRSTKRPTRPCCR